MWQGETSESLQGIFPGGLINHGKKRFYSLYNSMVVKAVLEPHKLHFGEI